MRINLRQNLYLKIFSLLIAVAAWFVVRSEDDRVKDFSVPVEYVNLAEALDLSGNVVDTVSIRLRGPEPILRVTTEDRLSARIDLSRAPLGAQNVLITPGMIQAPGGLEVVRITPDVVPVHLERRARREVPVVAEFSGSPPSGYRKGSHAIEPPTVIVEGPASAVAKVSRATVGTILLEGQTSSYEVEASPVPEAPAGSRVRVVRPIGPVLVRIAIAPVPPS